MGVRKIIASLRSTLAMESEGVAAALGVSLDELARWEREDSAPEETTTVLNGIEGLVDAVGLGSRELTTLAALVRAVTEQIKGIQSVDLSAQIANPRPFATIVDHTPKEVADYAVLRRQAYGRLVRARDVDDGVEKIYRIAWADGSWPDLRVYARHAPVIRRLMSAVVGQQVEVRTPQGERTLEVLEVSLWHRHADQGLVENLYNFEGADLLLDGRQRPAFRIEDVAKWVDRSTEQILEAFTVGQGLPARLEPPVEQQALVLESKSALSDRFFMSPLADQEDVMRMPSVGHVLVEGVAGSGKTSVALGRAAMVCMQSEDGEPGFQPETGVGFVLSEQLVGYLSSLLRGRLNLEKMPVRSYFKLRQQLIDKRDLLRKGMRRADADHGAQDPVVGRAAWASAVGELMARRILGALQATLPTEARELLPTRNGLTEQHWDAITRIDPRRGKEDLWEVFRRGLPSAFGVRGTRDLPSLAGALEALDARRASFADGDGGLRNLHPWDSPKFKDDRRRISQRLRDAIADAFNYAARYFEVLADDAFAECVEQHFANVPDRPSNDAIARAVREAKNRARRMALSNADIDVLLLVAHTAADGYRGRNGAEPIAHLSEVTPFTHVFIDEVQDFSQVQVRLMAAQADQRYRCVTAVGDFAQRLRVGGLDSTEGCGLALDEDRRVFLRQNKRQTAPLHALTSAYRADIQGDRRPSIGEPVDGADERPFGLGTGDGEVLASLCQWLTATRESHPRYTMAVLCPDSVRAAEIEKGLHEDLWAQNILSRAESDQMDASKLCDAYFVHFTTPLQAKGLEFDAVFAVDVDLYDMSNPVTQGALYVTLTRACRRLGIGFRSPPSPQLSALLQAHLGPPPS